MSTQGNLIKSNQQERVSYNAAKNNAGMWRGSLKGKGGGGMICCCTDSLMENEGMTATGSIKPFCIDCCHSGAARTVPALSFHRRGMLQDEKWDAEEPPSRV